MYERISLKNQNSGEQRVTCCEQRVTCSERQNAQRILAVPVFATVLIPANLSGLPASIPMESSRVAVGEMLSVICRCKEVAGAIASARHQSVYAYSNKFVSISA